MTAPAVKSFADLAGFPVRWTPEVIHQIIKAKALVQDIVQDMRGSYTWTPTKQVVALDEAAKHLSFVLRYLSVIIKQYRPAMHARLQIAEASRGSPSTTSSVHSEAGHAALNSVDILWTGLTKVCNAASLTQVVEGNFRPLYDAELEEAWTILKVCKLTIRQRKYDWTHC